MTKIPSVEKINGHRIIEQDETIKVYKGEVVLPISELIKTLTAERTALLTELREWAEKIKRCNSSEEHSRRRDHTTKSGYEIALDDFQAYIDNLINPT